MSSSEDQVISTTVSFKDKYDSSISSYIEKSPIATKFRLENPNLQPISDDESDTEMLATPPIQSLLDPGLQMSDMSSGFSDLSIKNDSSRARVKKMSGFKNSFAKFKSKSTPNISINSFDNNMTMNGPDLNLQKEGQVNNKQQTPFWKYHVLKFGNNLYLTTNPSLKHVYCRNGPGYYVEVIYNNPSSNYTKFKDGYKLIFEDIETIKSIKRDNRQPIMVIEKRAEELGGHITVSLLRESELIDGNIGYSRIKPPTFDRVLLPGIIDDAFTPFIKDMDVDFSEFKNYDFKDMNNIKWNVGPILRVRKSKMKRMKSRILSGMKDNINDEENIPQEKYFKLVNKKYVYFHRNYVKSDQPDEFTKTFYKEASGNAENTYIHDPEREFPPVLAVFRPCEMRRSKRVSITMSKNIQNLKGKQTQDSKISKYSLENDIGAGGDVKNYYIGGDGLYNQSHPADDAPDDNKLGWISIYEDSRVFSGRRQIGMFDIVIGTTLAAGLESYLTL